MYKSIISLYSKHCVVDDFIFIPDIFDTRFDWSSINFTDHMLQIIPEISDNSLPLQVIDIFTGIIGLGLRLKYLDKKYLTNSDKKRIPMVKTLEKLMNREIDKNFTITSPHYISTWTIDYSKKK